MFIFNLFMDEGIHFNIVMRKQMTTRQVSSMIHSARLISSFHFVLFCYFCEKWRWTDGCTDRRHFAKTMISTGCDCEMGEWINRGVDIFIQKLRVATSVTQEVCSIQTSSWTWILKKNIYKLNCKRVKVLLIPSYIFCS